MKEREQETTDRRYIFKLDDEAVLFLGSTVNISNITFLDPVNVGDAVCCYTEVNRIGRTSIALGVEVWVLREGQGERVKVTHAQFTFVAVNDEGRPKTLAASITR